LIVPAFGAIPVAVVLLVHNRSFRGVPLNVPLEVVLPALVGLAGGIALALANARWLDGMDRLRETNPDAVIASIYDSRRTVAEFRAALGIQQIVHPWSVAFVADGRGIALWSVTSPPAILAMIEWDEVGAVTPRTWRGPSLVSTRSFDPRWIAGVEVAGREIPVVAIPSASAIRARPDEADMIAFAAAVRAKRPSR